MSSQSPPSNYGRGGKWVECHAATIADLPEPPATFRHADADINSAELREAKTRGIVDRAGSDGGGRPLWQVREGAYERAQAIVDSWDSLPCGSDHTGFTVLRAGEEYQCNDCGTQHDRATVEAALFGGDGT